MLVISIQGNCEEAKEAIHAATKVGDALEFRLDLMETTDLPNVSKLKNYAKLPVIFTLRKQSHGGSFRGNETDRERMLLELLSLKPDYVDLECDSNFFDKIAPDIEVISSYHDFEKTPDNLEEILKNMALTSASIYKIATMANSSLDALKMLLFVKKQKNVAGMCMGNHGVMTRILAPVVNNPLTYTFQKKKTAPGQISISDLIEIYRYPLLNQSTQIYGLIGDPVDKSIGHLCHNQIFKKVRKNGVYVKIRLKPLEVPEFFTLVEKLPFAGLSVTMPLKEAVTPYLAAVDPQAKNIGAINTLVKSKTGWIGINSDGKGALDALEQKVRVAHKTLLIIGAGGAAKAISREASSRGARVIITNRTFKKAETLASQIHGEVIPINESNQCSYDIIINTTSVGMFPKVGETPIPSEYIRGNALGFDVIIHPKKTTFLKAIQNKGGEVVYGYKMYAQQALGQLKAWSIHGLCDEEILALIERFTLI